MPDQLSRIREDQAWRSLRCTTTSIAFLVPVMKNGGREVHCGPNVDALAADDAIGPDPKVLGRFPKDDNNTRLGVDRR